MYGEAGLELFITILAKAYTPFLTSKCFLNFPSIFPTHNMILIETPPYVSSTNTSLMIYLQFKTIIQAKEGGIDHLKRKLSQQLDRPPPGSYRCGDW